MLHMLWVLCLGLLALGMTESVTACASDGENLSALDEGYRSLYNLQFAAAHTAFTIWSQAHPEDPMGAVSHAAAYLFAELDRLHLLESEFFVDDARFLHQEYLEPDLASAQAFHQALATALAQTERILARQPQDRNALVARIFALGLRADYKALLKRQYLASLKDMQASRRTAEQLLARQPECYDAYLAIGVENYLLSLKPVLLRWVLRLGGAQTNRQAGIAALQRTATQGHYLQPYARLLLAVAALRDGDRVHARALLAALAVEFPHNQLYTAELARLY